MGRVAPSRDSGCAFCRIVAGEDAEAVVLREPHALAFLDRRPLFLGHCLVIPALHVQTLGELPNELVQPLFTSVQRVARAVEGAMGAEGSFVAVNNQVSQSVPHLHVHVVPRRRGDGLRGFFWPRTRYTDPGHKAEVAAAICSALGRERPG